MKKSICLLLAFLTLFSFSGCSDKEKTTVENEKTSVEQATGEIPFYEVGEEINIDGLVSVKIGGVIPDPTNGKVHAYFTFRNVSGKDLDVSRYQGFRVYVGDTDHFKDGGCFELISNETKRDYLNNEEMEKQGTLRADGIMMAMYEWEFILGTETSIENLFSENDKFFKNSKNLTLELSPWYEKGDISTQKKEDIKVNIDFKNVYETFNNAFNPVTE